MATLLVLGSKPGPVVPPLSRIDAVACANASGRSAQRLGLPTPRLTVLSSVVVSGKNPSNRLALQALAGLATDELYIYPRPPFAGRLLKQLRNLPAILRTTPPLLRLALSNACYRYRSIRFAPLEFYLAAIHQLCGDDAAFNGLLRGKGPSTGLIAIILALRDGRYQQVIVSGFSFEITHAYAENPDIARRQSAASLHAATDVAILARLAQREHRLVTTEPIVHQRTGLPLLRVDELR